LHNIFLAVAADNRPDESSCLAGTAVAVVIVAVVASYLPVRFAGRVDPLVVLRGSQKVRGRG